MPGVERHSISATVEQARRTQQVGTSCPASQAAKDAEATGAWDDEGIVQPAIQPIQQAVPELLRLAPPNPAFGAWGFNGNHDGTSQATAYPGQTEMHVYFYTPGADIRGWIPSKSSDRYTVTSSQGPGGLTRSRVWRSGHCAPGPRLTA